MDNFEQYVKVAASRGKAWAKNAWHWLVPFLYLIPLLSAVALWHNNLYPYMADPNQLKGGTNVPPPACIVAQNCANNVIVGYCFSNGTMCVQTSHGVRMPTCLDDIQCRKNLTDMESQVDGTATALNAIFAGLCVVMAYLYKGAIDSRELRMRVSEWLPLIAFCVAAYTLVYAAYWTRMSIATQLGGVVTYASTLKVIELTQLQANATFVVALAVLSATVATLLTPHPAKMETANGEKGHHAKG
ncbi:MAG TPA: hypothetical protein VII56_17595 [Rhizomicrobium sp.]